MKRILSSRNEPPYAELLQAHLDNLKTCNEVAHHLEDIANVMEYASMVDLENLREVIVGSLRELAVGIAV
jgi:hypothetical protein